MGTLIFFALLACSFTRSLCLHFPSEDPSAGKTACPGGEQSCADGYTCCEMKQEGLFSCCPVRDAVCCEDKIHCCPKGRKCNSKSGGCDKIPEEVTASKMVVKELSQIPSLNSSSVICPDGVYQCPDDTTCCPLSDAGQYGCCPLKDATCCPDRQHCCPHGYQCTDLGMCILSP